MIDCTNAAASKNPIIVLKGKRIDKVGTKEGIKIPQGAEVLDYGSCTLILGMMDIHLHTMSGSPPKLRPGCWPTVSSRFHALNFPATNRIAV